MFIILTLFIDYDILNKLESANNFPKTSISYLVGALGSAIAGFVGMAIATRANTRTAVKAAEGLNPALRVAFNSGSVMGISVVGIGLLGITILYLIFEDANILAGFGFGASSIALFARVGGGIYTKAADVGADLVGKVEAGIPEDDPRNPATIADNVGDNVGDVAGMGADLFESYIGSIIATLALASVATIITVDTTVTSLKILPFVVATIGLGASIIGTFFVRTGENADMGRLLWSLRTGIFAAGAIVLIGAGLYIFLNNLDFNLFWVILIGLVAGQTIGTASEIYTSYEFKFTKNLAEQAKTGPATVIIGGLGLGMLSTAIPALVVVIAMYFTYQLADTYGVALAAVGMLSTLGITLATDAYGPVADNAGGIAEQAHMAPEVRERTDALDSLGNTTAATGKGFAIGSAVLTALALLAAYATVTKVELFDLRDTRAVDISTQGAMKEMILPGLLSIIVPIAVGVILGAEALGGLLIGSIATGFLLAIMMANAGGAWDNAKKYIEAGNIGGKGSDSHSAAVVGDTVGDPFKDTSGPALNILIKLMSIVALVFGPLFV